MALDVLEPLKPALQRFFGLPYWSRLWVCQEIVLAKKLTVFLGSRCFDWDLDLFRMAKWNSWFQESIIMRLFLWADCRGV
jgi:hypothetical protein